MTDHPLNSFDAAGAAKYIENVVAHDVNFFDHADIYYNILSVTRYSVSLPLQLITLFQKNTSELHVATIYWSRD